MEPALRIILIKGRSTYDLLRAFIDDAATGFAEAGHAPEILDVVAEPDIGAGLARRAAEAPIDLVYSLNILGDFRDPEGRTLGDIAGAPHVLHFVDHPLSHLERLEKTPANAAVLTIDPSHADAIVSIYGEDRFAYVGFCPHAAVGPTTSPGADVGAFQASRPIPILFPGTYAPVGAPPWSAMQAGVQRLFEAAVEIALASEWTAGHLALDAAMRSAGLSPEDPQFSGFRKLASYVHERVRAVRRTQVLDAAARAGLLVHVAGKGYDGLLARFPNLTFAGDVGFLDSVTLMARSRVVLNINANFGAGSHERPLCALNAGAAAISDLSSFYADHFEEGREMSLYRWRDLGAGIAALSELAGDPRAAFEMATAGQVKVLAGHRWKHRAAVIIAAAEQARSRLSAPALRKD
jgi:Glycosyl transferases group 1